MSEELRAGMVREDWVFAAYLVGELLIDEPDSRSAETFNIGIEVARRRLMEESLKYPWAEASAPAAAREGTR